MATIYTGNPTATQAPGAQPDRGLKPTISIPSDADGGSWANAQQPLKELADFCAWNNPILFDDFLGDTLNRSIWNGAQPAKVTITTDAANGASGIYQAADAVNESWTATPSSGVVNLGAGDWHLLFRARFPNFSGWNASGGSSVLLQSQGGTAARNMGFNVGSNAAVAGNVSAVVANGYGAQDLGVAVNAATYSLFELRKVSGTLSWLINGVVKYSQADAQTYSDAQIQLTSASTTGANSGSMNIDYVRVW